MTRRLTRRPLRGGIVKGKTIILAAPGESFHPAVLPLATVVGLTGVLSGATTVGSFGVNVSVTLSGVQGTGTAGVEGVVVSLNGGGVSATGSVFSWGTIQSLKSALAVGYVGGSNTTINSVSENLTSSLRFSADGTSLFSFADGVLHEYTLSEAGNPLTAVWAGSSNIGVVVGASSLKGLDFSPDGSKLMCITPFTAQVGATLTRTSGIVNAAITGHGLVTGRRIRVFSAVDTSYNTATALVTVVDADNVTYTNAGSDGSTTGNVDGAGICICALSPAWDISSATFDSAAARGGESLAFSDDGNVLLHVYSSSASVDRYELPAPYAISTVDVGSYGTPPLKNFFDVDAYVGGSGSVTNMSLTSDSGLVFVRGSAANRINLNFSCGYPVSGVLIQASNLVGICQSPKGYIVGVDSSSAFHILGGQGFIGVGGVEVALSGVVSGAFAAGTLTPVGDVVSVALTGVQATGARGNFGTAIGLTSASATGARGNIGTGVGLTSAMGTGAIGSPVISAALTNVLSTSAVGTPAVAFSVGLTGIQVTGSAGAEGVGIALNGAQGTGTIGALTPDTSTQVALIGVQATGSLGALGIALALTGTTGTGTGATGAFGTALGLTNVLATGAVGSPVISAALSGVVATGVSGTLSTGFILSGVSATGVAGTLSTAIGLTGVIGSAGTGTLAANLTSALMNVLVTGAVGTPVTNISIDLIGIQATGNAGVEGVALALNGAQGTGQNGTYGVSASIALTNVLGTGSAGSLGTGAALTGVQGTGQTGALSVTESVALTNVLSTGSVGTLGTGHGITSVTGTGAIGTTPVIFSIGLTNVIATGFAGVEGTGTTLTGSEGTGENGAFGVSSSVALTGTSATTATGSVGTGLRLVGGTATGLNGTPTPSITVTSTGVSATGFVGVMNAGNDVSVALFGVSGSAFINDTFPVSFNTTLSNVLATGSAGVVGVSQALTGYEATGGTGSTGAVFTIGLTGNQATGYAGVPNAGADTSVALTGVNGSFNQGLFGVNLTIPNTGVEVTGYAGSISAAFTLDMNGVEGAGVAGNLIVPSTVGLLGTSSTGAVGTLLPVSEYLAEQGGVFVLHKDVPITVHLVTQSTFVSVISEPVYALTSDTGITVFTQGEDIDVSMPPSDIRVAA